MSGTDDSNPFTKSCTCVSGILSINPSGDVIPCSAYSRSIGNLLNDSFDNIWNSDQALYFREKKYIPAICKKCSFKVSCKGGCPLYWAKKGSFRELERINKKIPLFGKVLRLVENRLGVNKH